MRDLWQLLEKVEDERTLLEFAEALGEDFAEARRIERSAPPSPFGAGALGWQNCTIDDMLESAVAWARDSPAREPINAWRRCAEILFAGKHYE